MPVFIAGLLNELLVTELTAFNLLLKSGFGDVLSLSRGQRAETSLGSLLHSQSE